MKLRKLNQIGDHVVIIGVFIVLFGVAGTFWLLQDHAQTPQQELKSNISLGSGTYCLDDFDTAHTRVDDYKCNGSKAQAYSFSNGEIHLDNLCVGVSGAAINKWPTQANVDLGDCSPSAPWGGLWTPGRNGSFINQHSRNHYGTDYCLDITGGAVANATVEIYKCTYGSNESWAQAPAPSTTSGSGGSGNSGAINPQAICTQFGYSGSKCSAVDSAATYIAGTYSSWNNQTEFECLGELWSQESGWDSIIMNQSSGAFGIAQALDHGGTSAVNAYIKVQYNTPSAPLSGPVNVNEYPSYAANDGAALYQEIWGFQYIQATYGDPCTAWNHEVKYHWYAQTTDPKTGAVVHT